MVPYYYPRSIERVTIGLLDVFNDIKINRFDDSGDVVKIIDVPIITHNYKNLSEFIINTSKVKESRHQVPIMGLRINGITRDADRITQQKFVRNVYDKDRDKYLHDRRPSNWVINYTLSVFTENIEDFMQLIENIVTYFDPTLTVAIKEFEKVNIERDIIVNMASASLEIADEVAREEYQSYTMDIPLEAHAVFYPPLYASGIITEIKQNISDRGTNISTIDNKGLYPMTIDQYQKQLNEIVEEGRKTNSIVVSKILENSDSTYKLYVGTVLDSSTLLVTVPANASIVYAEILILESYGSYTTTFSIGTESNNELVMKTSENSPYFVAKYGYSFNMKMVDDTNIYLYYNRSNATTGSAIITLSWN